MGSRKFLNLATTSSFICLFCYAATLCVSHACNNEINRLFHITNTQMGVLFMMIYVGFIPATLLTGRLSDTKGKLPVVFVGTILMMLGLVEFIMTTNFYVALSAMFLMGLGGGCTETNATGLIGDIYTGTKRTKMMSFVQTSFGLGALAGPLIVGLFLKVKNSYNGAFITIAILTFIGFLFVLTTLFNNEEKPVGLNTEKVPWKEIAKDKYIWLIVAGLILYCGAELGFSGWIAVYFEKILLLGKSSAVQSVALIWLGIAVGSAFFAMLAKKLTPLKILKISFVGVVLMFIVFYIKIPACAVFGAFAVGFFLGPIFPTIIGMGSARYKEYSGSINSVLFTAGNLGGALFPLVMGVLVDLTDVKRAVLVVPVLTIINFLVFCNKVFGEKNG